jgi:hypothetical protein
MNRVARADSRPTFTSDKFDRQGTQVRAESADPARGTRISNENEARTGPGCRTCTPHENRRTEARDGRPVKDNRRRAMET